MTIQIYYSLESASPSSPPSLSSPRARTALSLHCAIIRGIQNIAEEVPQYATRICIFPWEKLPSTSSVFAQRHLTVEKRDRIGGAFRVNEVDNVNKDVLDRLLQCQTGAAHMGTGYTYLPTSLQSVRNRLDADDLAQQLPRVDVVGVSAVCLVELENHRVA